MRTRFDAYYEEWTDRHWLMAGLLGVAVLAPGVVFLAVFLYWPMASNAVRAVIDEPLFFAILVILGLVGLLDYLRRDHLRRDRPHL